MSQGTGRSLWSPMPSRMYRTSSSLLAWNGECVSVTRCSSQSQSLFTVQVSNLTISKT